MKYSATSQYLESKVFTASQPQLQLMLLDGALRFGRQAKELWNAKSPFAEVDQQLARMADIVDELTYGAAQGTTEISKQLEEQYAFIYRDLTSSRINQDTEKLDGCLLLLQYQRETWRLVCDRLETEATSVKPLLPHISMKPHHPSQGLSAEV